MRIYLNILLVLVVLLFGFFFEKEEDNDELIYKDGVLIQCGVERWSIKTCIDSDTTKINFNNIIPSTIAYQRSLPVQTTLPANNRLPLEDTVYSLTCHLIKYKLEADQDIHLVISTINNPNETMIAEICDPACPSIINTSRYAELSTLRTWFVSNYNPTSSWKNANVNIHITGVGFYDFPHGQTGAAPNQREIHPILAMTLASVGISIISNEIPSSYLLYQNYPNPFNPSTTIKFSIPQNSNAKTGNKVTLKVYNLLGKEVVTLVNESLQPGTYEVPFNVTQYSDDLNSSGVYFYRLKTEEYSDVKRMLLIK
jgi:hypothetical protein